MAAMEPATKKPRIANTASGAPDPIKLSCEHIHIDTSIYDELISSPNSRFIINNNKWLIINMQYIWEFIPTRVKFIKRTEVPSSDASTRLFQVISDEENNQVIFLGLSAVYVVNINNWQWTQYDNKIKAPINAPNYAAEYFIFSYDNDKLFRGTLPFNGDLEKIATSQPKGVKINYPWVNNAILYLGDYYFINTIHHVHHYLIKLCMAQNEFVVVGKLNGNIKGQFTFGFERFNWLYFISDHNTMLTISEFETEEITLKVMDLPANPFLPTSLANQYIGSFQEPLTYYAFDGNNLILFNKRRLTCVKLDLNFNTWSQPIIFEDYPPPLHNYSGGSWIRWNNSGLFLTAQKNLDTVFLFDAKTWTWTAKQCFVEPSYFGEAPKLSWMQGAVHENYLYVCGCPINLHSTAVFKIHRLDLNEWMWSKVRNFEEEESGGIVDNTAMYNLSRRNDYSPMFVANNKLYFLTIQIGKQTHDWIALDLEANKWTKKERATKSNPENMHHKAADSTANNCVYILLDGNLETLSLADQKIEKMERRYVSASSVKDVVEWGSRLVIVSSLDGTTPLNDLRFFDTTSNSYCDVTWTGDDPHLYRHTRAVQLHDQVFALTTSKTITRIFKDVQVKSLQHLATTALCGYLDMDNVFTLLDYSVNLRNRVLQQGCIVFLKNNTLKLMQRIDEINQLSPEIKDILAATFTYLPIRQ